MHQVNFLKFKILNPIFNKIFSKDQLITNVVKLKTLEAYQTFIGRFKPRLPKNIIESPVKVIVTIIFTLRLLLFSNYLS
jgi:hypothetical protein